MQRRWKCKATNTGGLSSYSSTFAASPLCSLVVKPFELAIEALGGAAGFGPAIIIFTIGVHRPPVWPTLFSPPPPQLDACPLLVSQASSCCSSH
eukprot:scaffold201726_cov32-Tisochrysis_lutea.AAC.2